MSQFLLPNPYEAAANHVPEIPSIALNTFKGGVSKTTTTFNLAWKFTEDPNRRVLVVDADAQCNLTQVFLQHILPGNQAVADIFRFVRPHLAPCITLGESLNEVVGSNALTPPEVQSIPHYLRPNLHLLPGSIHISDYEQAVAAADLSRMPAMRNIPGAFHALVQATARRMNADLILIDTSPSMGPLNMVIVMSSMFFLLPCQADFFSLKAIESMRLRIFEHGGVGTGPWIERMTGLQQYTASTVNKLPVRKPKFLGAVVQMFTIRSNEPAAAFQYYIRGIERELENHLAPLLFVNDMNAWNSEDYTNVGLRPYIIAQIQNFNRFAPMAQDAGVPVLGLLENHKLITQVDNDTQTSKPLSGNQLEVAVTSLFRMTEPISKAAEAIQDMVQGIHHIHE
jgi:chromosome partitioning protein